MKSRSTTAGVAALLTLAAVGAWPLIARCFYSDAEWNGRTMAEWVDHVTVAPPPQLYCVDSSFIGSLTVGEACEAARNLGSNAVPALMLVLRERESPLRELALSAWYKLPDRLREWVGMPRLRAYQRSVVALHCVEQVLAYAGPASLTLVDRMESEPSFEAWILRMLGSMGREASPAVPALAAKLMQSTDPAQLARLAEALWKIGPASDPVLMEASRSPEAAVALVGEVGSRWIAGDTNGVIRRIDARLFGAPHVAETHRVPVEPGMGSGTVDRMAKCAEHLAAALGAGLEPMRPALLGRLAVGEIPVVRERAARVLMGIGPGNAGQATVDALLAAARRETDPEALRAELWAIGAMRVKSAAVMKALDGFLHGADEETIMVAREVSGSLSRGDFLGR